MPRHPQAEAASSRAPIVATPTGAVAFVGRFGGCTPGEVVRVTGAEQIRDRLGAHSEAALAMTAFFANGGRCAYAVTVEPADQRQAAPLLGSAATGTGLHAIRDLDDVDVVCIPDACRLTADAAGELYRAAALLCEQQRVFLLIDLPRRVRTASEIIGWVLDQHVRHRNAGLYVPQVMLGDQTRPGTPRPRPASGAVAGIYARTDAARGVWTAAAGPDAALLGIDGLAAEVSRPDQERLNGDGVNVLRLLPGRGHLVWGARTLVGDGSDRDWTYVAARRTALMIERSVERGLRWAASEPNDLALWSVLRRAVEEFLMELWRVGGLAGSTPADASFVRCGLDQTMTAADIDDGVAIVELGLALSKPAEFTVVRVRLATAGDDAAPNARHRPEGHTAARLGLTPDEAHRPGSAVVARPPRRTDPTGSSAAPFDQG